MASNKRPITVSFQGGTVSCDPELMKDRSPRNTFAIAFDHRDTRKSGGYFIRQNGEIVRVGGSRLPALGALLASIGSVASNGAY